MRFKCNSRKPVLLRFRTGNAAKTAFELRKNGSEDPIAIDPDLDGNAAFAVNPPGDGELPADDYTITVTPAAIDLSQKVPVRFFVEQGGSICEPIDSDQEPTEHGYLLGEMDSDTSREYWFRLLFVL